MELELVNEIKETLTQYVNIKSVDFNEEENQFYVYYEEDDGSRPYNNSFLDIIRTILFRNGLEIGGLGEISNWEVYNEARKKFELENPRPKDPRLHGNWSQKSYYWRTKGEGSRILEAWKVEIHEWTKKIRDSLPPRILPGFTFDVQKYGENQKVFDFYKDTKYWGD